MACLKQRLQILDGYLRRQGVGRPYEVGVAERLAQDVNRPVDMVSDLGRRKDHDFLIADSATEGDLTPKLPGNPRKVHRFGLERVQHVNPGINQIAYDGSHVAATVKDDIHVPSVRFVAEAAITGREELPPHAWRDHQRGLGAPIIGEKPAINAAELSP